MRPCQSNSGSAKGEDGHRAPEGQGGPGRGRGERAPRAPGPGGDVAPVAVRHRCGVLVLTLRVPFQSLLEADMARIIQKEFAVNGCDLMVRWTAEDLAFIRISINPFLDQLSLVIQSIRSLVIPPFLG
ncbi:hypothetical protein FD755_023191 [Muntiacus reevesi]|uniref:Uncharacterized protein n=1 Tax=Muntiacus reevesi TaxID=9886 RepID=A0A5N3VXM8_MUNRE|nr:hypothetical protein FD755_023191 [Muntiacus reevesi]